MWKVECINEDCNENKQKTSGKRIRPYSYALPQAGSISGTGEICPINNVQILAISPNIKTNTGYRKRVNQTYFWATIPCNACKNKSQCLHLKEVLDDFD